MQDILPRLPMLPQHQVVVICVKTTDATDRMVWTAAEMFRQVRHVRNVHNHLLEQADNAVRKLKAATLWTFLIFHATEVSSRKTMHTSLYYAPYSGLIQHRLVFFYQGRLQRSVWGLYPSSRQQYCIRQPCFFRVRPITQVTSLPGSSTVVRHAWYVESMHSKV